MPHDCCVAGFRVAECQHLGGPQAAGVAPWDRAEGYADSDGRECE
jgi:hypothetical protein